MNNDNRNYRDEYLEYLEYVQLSDQPEPTESYIDWAGLEVLSFKDWMVRNNENEPYSPRRHTKGLAGCHCSCDTPHRRELKRVISLMEERFSHTE